MKKYHTSRNDAIYNLVMRSFKILSGREIIIV